MLSAWNAKISTSVASRANMLTGAKRGSSCLLKPIASVRSNEIGPQRRAGGKRNHDEDRDSVQQHLKRHVQRRGPVHQEADDRREQDQHDQVIDRDLHQRVGRVAVGQVTPDEDHRRAGSGGQDDAAGDVLIGVAGEIHAANT